ncbi:MAG: AI-2E family transporter [Acidobacteria bacterium]|nr:AI-2E family transporter [Acidobacteriota bacterium]
MTLPDSPKANVLIYLAAFCVVIAGLKEARDIVLQVLIAGFAAIAVAPPIFYLKSRGVPFVLSLILVMALLLGIVGFMAGVVGSSINDFTDQLPMYEDRGREAIGQIVEVLHRFGVNVAVDEAIAGLFDPGQMMGWVGGLFAGLGSVLANSFLIFIMAIFLLLEASTFPTKLQAAFGDQNRVVERFQNLGSSINHYLVIKTWASLATGGLAAGLCFAFGLDFALLWGLLAFLLNYVPNVGSVVAGVPPVLLAIVQLGLLKASLILVGYILINNILGNFIEPRFMGKGLGLSTFAVLVSLVFWGWVLGPVGMLLSIPLTMAVKIAMEGRPETLWIAVLLGPGADAEVRLERMQSGEIEALPTDGSTG